MASFTEHSHANNLTMKQSSVQALVVWGRFPQYTAKRSPADHDAASIQLEISEALLQQPSHNPPQVRPGLGDQSTAAVKYDSGSQPA